MEPGSRDAFDFDAAVRAPFRMQPGLRRLPEGAPQLTPNRPGSRALREKGAVLSSFPASALVQAPGFDPGPALDALCVHAASEQPEAFAWRGETATAQWLGWRVDKDATVTPARDSAWCDTPEVGRCLAALPPEWRRAGLLALAFAEDFAFVDATRGTIPWMAVCLPSHWAPETKVGRHFTDVHAPVADNALLLQASSHLMRLVTGPQRWERFVWTITSHSRLHAHPRRVSEERWPAAPDPAAFAANAYWRTERQSFIPLPERQQAVFTILVDVRPLAAALAPGDASRQVHDALASMSPAVLAYRGLTDAQAPLLAWLDARAAPR